jgi:hypothetical protein
MSGQRQQNSKQNGPGKEWAGMIETELNIATQWGEMRSFWVRPDRGGLYPLAIISPDGVPLPQHLEGAPEPANGVGTVRESMLRDLDRVGLNGEGMRVHHMRQGRSG